MAEAAAKAAYESLEEFLDTLPKTPCEATPINRYYCTVCERLNKGVANRCSYSTLTPDSDSSQHVEGSTGAAQVQIGGESIQSSFRLVFLARLISPVIMAILSSFS